MIIEQLMTNHFKGLPDREFSFGDGITLVVGPNRAGKSTLHQALLTALFGLGKTADGLPSEWKEVLPWGFTGQGSLLLQYRVSSGRFRLERTTGRAGAKLMQEHNGEWQTISTDAREVQKSVLSHIGVDSPSVFARTVSVAQGDLARLEQADRQEIGRALEEVLVGRSGATFQQALKHLDEKVRKPLRREGRERILQKVDRYEADVSTLQEEIGQAQDREEELEQARQTLRDIEAQLPAKKERLKQLTGDPEKGEPVGLLTKLAQKRRLEEQRSALSQETKSLQTTVEEVKHLRRGIDELTKHLTADESLLEQDLEQLEKELAARQQAVILANAAVESCGKRLEETGKGLQHVSTWLDEHPTLRDNADAVKDAESAVEEKAKLGDRLDAARTDLEKLVQERPHLSLPTWQLVAGIVLLLGATISAWLARSWVPAALAIPGGLLLVSYFRRAGYVRRVIQDFEQRVGVQQGIIDRLGNELRDRQAQLDTSLRVLGVPEGDLKALLAEHRKMESRCDSLSKQRGEEEGRKKAAEQDHSNAIAQLSQLCRPFGMDSADHLKAQISVVRKLKKQEEQERALLRGRTLEDFEAQLTEKSVELRGVRGQLQSPQYADFAPTTEEVEAWRREATQLAEAVPALERERSRVEGRIETLEPQVRSHPSSHELDARLEWLEDEVSRGDRTVQACHEAERLLREIQKEHRTTYLPELERATSVHLRRMTNGFYCAASLASGWPGVSVADPRNTAVAPHELSAGSRDQLYFAFRLAVADQLSGGELLPMLLDEAFPYFDDEHWQRALDIIADVALSGRQVIYFTMHPEVEQDLRAGAAGRFPVEVIHLPPPDRSQLGS
jgi:exonuclease SbcC